MNDWWAPPPPFKNDDTLRFGYQNIGGLPKSILDSKNQAFRSFLLEYFFDIFGLGETNLKWSVLSAEELFQERVRNSWGKTHC
jgi:hypothetical protein